MAYGSDDSGRDEIYVRAFPAAGGRWQISSSGGTHPMWSRTGLELFYQGLDNRIMVADYSVAADSFTPGKPRLWSNTQIRAAGGVANLDLAPDGKRFAIFPVPEAPIQSGSVHMMFLLNFFDEARRLLPDK
jgi:serine/threonine-protein kinase